MVNDANSRRTSAAVGHRSREFSRVWTLDLSRSARFERPCEDPQRDAATILVFEKGIEHEQRHLASLKAQGLNVVMASREGFDITERAAVTEQVFRAGADVIYQAALIAPPWLGYTDFLERVNEKSSLGSWSYEALDTKLSRQPSQSTSSNSRPIQN